MSVVTRGYQNPFADLASTGYQFLSVKLADGTVFLALKGFEVFNGSNPPTRSDGSGAVYLAQGVGQMNGLLVQWLPPNSRTSWHTHRSKTEWVINLAGSCQRGQNDEGAVVDATDCSYLVLPNQAHFLQTGVLPALNLLVITSHNGGDPLNADDYTYREFDHSYPPT
ncbi:hypothetical protein KKG41_01360 [Patescibacteria group bacterium]|nr:hypothetical protein [Patescibacteria group bacterium]MBU1890924.1 hypothetical protein [Patescibacteria group bacterium]